MISSNHISEIKLELSYRCNMNCLHCSSEGSKDKNVKISLEESLNIINSALKLKIKSISLSGGEPLLWPNLYELVNYYKKNEVTIKLYTNGATQNFEEILSRIKKTEMIVIFSLYGSDPLIHDNVTGIEGSFYKTLSSMKYTLKRGFKSEIHFVPLSINYKELIPLNRLVSEIGINKISILRFVPQGRGANRKSLILNKKQNLELKEDILKLRRSGFSIRTGSPLNFLLIKNQPECTSGINKLVIAPDLHIYPCDAFKQIKSDKLFGYDEFSSLNNHTLEDCWENSVYLDGIRKILNLKYQEPCLSCPEINLCRSGCVAQKIMCDYSLNQITDPSCLIY